MRVVGQTERVEIILDTDEQVIWVTQKWKCNLLVWDRKLGKWTDTEKSRYKRQLKSIIQNLWSDKAYAIINSQNGIMFNEQYGKTAFRIKIDIEFTDTGYHWEVNICKPNSFDDPYDFVHWDNRQVFLNNFSIRKVQYLSMNDSNTPGSYFWSSAHEFGHMIGNTKYCNGGGTGDEYPTLHLLHKDVNSIMNNGSEIRHRHFIHVRNLLQKNVFGKPFQHKASLNNNHNKNHFNHI